GSARFIGCGGGKARVGGAAGWGWSFTIVLAGQDGFSPDQARGFLATASDFQFGVCAAASADPHCISDPVAIAASIPKVIDTITPPGVSQRDELDYTIHPAPVVLHAVVMP